MTHFKLQNLLLLSMQKYIIFISDNRYYSIIRYEYCMPLYTYSREVNVDNIQKNPPWPNFSRSVRTFVSRPSWSAAFPQARQCDDCVPQGYWFPRECA